MTYTYIPRGPLAGFVERFWIAERIERPHARERVLPSGTVDLVVDLSPGVEPVMMAAGAHASPFVYRAEGVTTALGVAFRPGGAAPFLGVPAGEIQDAIVPLGDLWGRAGSELGERLATDTTPAARFERLERVLLGRLERARRRHPAVAAALGAFGEGVGGPDVGAMAERVGLSRRRLIQAFRAEVGLPPKLYCRVRRFGLVLQATAGSRAVAWAAVAQACGYCDQAHMIRDFREFAGASPTGYLAARGDGPNPFHVPEPG